MTNINEEIFKQFIQKNHNLVKEYYEGYYNRYKEKNFKEQLRILFVNSLSAGGEGKIKQKADSIRRFEEKINKMNECTYSELLKAFNAHSYLELFEAIKDFKQMGPKKSALFLRDIFYFGNIFEGSASLKKEFLIPVDRVITRTVNSIFNKKYPQNNDKTFDEINLLGKKVFSNEPILLEDLWFWGRFYRCLEEKANKDIPYCKFNEDLLYVDKEITKEYRKKVIKFAESHKDCPFREICSQINLKHMEPNK